MNELRHVAIILDGNRRFAKRLMAEPWRGHEWGYEKVKDLINWCVDLGIEELTLYAFSLQNFQRPQTEFDFLMRLAEKVCDDFLSGKISDEKIVARFIGRTQLLNDQIQRKMRAVEEETKDNQGIHINICFAYGGKEEITDAVQQIARKLAAGEILPEQVDESLIQSHLQLVSEPDLIIRTGGERRTSNFLVWQSSYAELYFTDVLWPEFQKEHFLAAIADFEQRKRRFGK